jgi:hypothetical protein
VKPTRSTKRTETTRRSATAVVEPVPCGSIGATPSTRRAPHSLQNLALGPFEVAQAAHVRRSEAPQSLQNFASGGLSAPQLPQIMFSRP